jgi:glycerol uptake facilitator-like aquaporin
LTLPRRLFGEALGTAMLLATVVGSGIMAERLADGNVALALLANAIATGAVLVALILALGPVSGAHFNPAVSLAMALAGRLRWRELPCYAAVQIAAGIGGVALAHLMFDHALLEWSLEPRSGASQVLSEIVATFGLVFVILGCLRAHDAAVAYAVGAYIAAAYWFTASTSFANPAVTVARAMTDTFSGIRPADVPPFLLAQAAGAVLAVAAWRGSRPPDAASHSAG